MSKVFNPIYSIDNIAKIKEEIITKEKAALSHIKKTENNYINKFGLQYDPKFYENLTTMFPRKQAEILALDALEDQNIRKTALTIHHAETFNFSDAQPNSWIATLLTNKFSIDERSEDFIITLAIYAEAGLINLSYGKDVEAPENNAQQVSNNNNNYIEPDDEDRLSYTEKINKERKDAKYCCAIS